MSIISKSKHDQCEAHIDFDFVNQHGQPALCCSHCVTRKGKRAGKPQWIQWISRTDAIQLVRDPSVDIRGDVYSYTSNTKKVNPKHKHILTQRGEIEPDGSYAPVTVNPQTPPWHTL